MGDRDRPGLATIAMLAFTATVGCRSAPTGTGGSIEQLFLFEIEHVNFAWGLHWAGVYVDREGRIVAYDHSHAPWIPAAEDAYGEDELQAKFSHEARVVGQVDAATLLQAFAMIDRVRDEWSDPRAACADAGGIEYVAFRYDADSARYRPILLRLEGDWVRKNTSSAGESLAGWLRELLLNLDEPAVQPFTDGSCTP